MADSGESPAFGVDVLETVLLLGIPALAFATVLAVVAGTQHVLTGLLVGGLFGTILARYRVVVSAYLVGDSVERRYREPPRDTRLARVARTEYAPKWDRLLVVRLSVVAVAGFAAAIAVGVDGGLLTVLLVVTGFFCSVSALMAIGSLETRASR